MKRYGLYMAVLLLSFGCSRVLDEGVSEDKGTGVRPGFISTKVTNTPDTAVEGMVLVNLKEGSLPADLSFDRVDFSPKSIEKAFPSTPANAGKLKKYGLDSWYVVNFDTSIPLSYAAKALSDNAHVKNIQFNKRLVHSGETASYAAAVPAGGAALAFNDPYLMDQWHYHNVGNTNLVATARPGADINVYDAWTLTAGDPSIVVAVLDAGVQYTHPDLAANMWVNDKEGKSADEKDNDGNGYVDDIHGYSFTNEGSLSWGSSHGTHVAGTVAAVNNNGIGVSGIAGGTGNGDGVRIMSCQVLNDEGKGNALSAARAFVYAADNGAAIAQCSFGYPAGTFPNDATYAVSQAAEYGAIQYFIENAGCDGVLDGGIVIFSAGNEASDVSGYPAALPDVISVTSIGPDFLPAPYTNYGLGCNIAAPGGDIAMHPEGRTAVLSTVPAESSETGEEYEYMQGTSMACPHVSGVAALGLSYAKKLGISFTNKEFIDMILTSVNDLEYYLDGSKDGLDLEPYRKNMGTGLIDAWRLLMQIEGTPCLTAAVGKDALVSLDPYFGGGSSTLVYDTAVEMTDDAMAALGLTEKPSVVHGKLKIHCAKAGSAKLTVTAYTGGTAAGEGTAVTKEISVVAREVAASNGGWL